MDLTIRSMQPNEVREAHKIIRKAFGVLEGIFTPKPKTALVAELDGRIVGVFAYSIEQAAGKKVGFASIFATHPDVRGQGIGKRICAEGIQHLWNEGCDELVTYVRDDNVASWGAFERDGFVRANFADTARVFGIAGAAKLYIKTMMAFCLGHDFYIALKSELPTTTQERKSSAGQVAIFVLINSLLAISLALNSRDSMLVISAFAAVMASIALTGYVGTLFSKRNWRFRFVDGGIGVSFIISIFRGYFPIVGNWYPEKYENTPEFRRDLAITGIVPWVFLIGLYAVCLMIDATIANLVSQIVYILLLFRCMAVAPLSSYGGGRVYDWNKTVFSILAGISITLLFVLPRLGII